jgi:prolyl oligopeptidase
MNFYRTLPQFFIAALLLAGCANRPPHIAPVTTRTTDLVEVLHGVNVADPYRWLEDDHSPETKAWVAEQNRATFAHLGKIPAREAIRSRLTQLWNYERYSTPYRKGDRYFFSKNNGLQNQSVLYTTHSLDAEPEILLDPNALSTNGTVALSGMSVSPDGKLLAYGISRAGSDWQEWKIRDVRTGEDLPDHLQWVKFSGAAWKKDASGFFYSRYDAPVAGNEFKGVNKFHKLYFHRLGTEQSADTLIYERPDKPDWSFGGGVTDDGRFLVISIGEGTDPRNRVYYKDLSEADASIVPLLDDFDADYSLIDNRGPVFYFRTDKDASKYRVIAMDIRQPAPKHWREIIPQSTNTLTGVSFVGGSFLCTYLRNARSFVTMSPLDTSKDTAFGTAARWRELELPGIGTVSGFGGEADDVETFFNFTSFAQPGGIYRLEPASGKITVWKRSAVDFNPVNYETRQVFYSSKDGTRVPMFISHKRGLKLDGRNPTLLYGYGGFNISLTPSFSAANLTWMEMGGVYAVPNLRGGGEYGESWHKAGTKLSKQNVFDDFIAAAEWLIANKYTAKGKLAISGGSNGGLLVGACLTQRPDLFGACLPAVGVLDMLRFHKFTIGWAWTSDFGSPDNAEEFRALLAYSPLHRIKPGTKYPATLITTGDHDDRVVPGHSFKFAAALQAAQAGSAPVLIRIETDAGHGAGKPTAKVIEESADRLAFLVESLRMTPLLPAQTRR